MSARQEKKFRRLYNQQLNSVAKKDFDLYNQIIIGRLKLYQWLTIVFAVVILVLLLVLVGMVCV